MFRYKKNLEKNTDNNNKNKIKNIHAKNAVWHIILAIDCGCGLRLVVVGVPCTGGQWKTKKRNMENRHLKKHTKAQKTRFDASFEPLDCGFGLWRVADEKTK